MSCFMTTGKQTASFDLITLSITLFQGYYLFCAILYLVRWTSWRRLRQRAASGLVRDGQSKHTHEYYGDANG